jgi:integrase
VDSVPPSACGRGWSHTQNNTLIHLRAAPMFVSKFASTETLGKDLRCDSAYSPYLYEKWLRDQDSNLGHLIQSHSMSNTNSLTNNGDLLTKFLASRRQGTSPRTIAFYEMCVKPLLNSYELTAQDINRFLADLKCSPGGKHAYFRAIRAFVNWAVRNDYVEQNPLTKVDPPKPARRVLPDLSPGQVEYLIDKADGIRDKCIISLFTDSGLRLTELASITSANVNWDTSTVTIWGKGNKQRRAPFSPRTASLLRQWLSERGDDSVNGQRKWHSFGPGY